MTNERQQWMDDAAAAAAAADDNVEANEKRETRKSYSIIFNTKQKYVIIMQME